MVMATHETAGDPPGSSGKSAPDGWIPGGKGLPPIRDM
jgi:hypothetical protein